MKVRLNAKARKETALRSDVIQKWNPGLKMRAPSGARELDVFGVVGDDPEYGGLTEGSTKAFLSGLGPADEAVVNINSPGGDFFAGLAIYNMLRNHPANVTVNILGMAGSAASIIAMAGNTVRIAESAFVMIHNVWSVVMGNRHDLREAADMFEQADASMAQLYARRTGADLTNIREWMDAETWFDGPDAIESRFADTLMPADLIEENAGGARAEQSERLKAKLLLDNSLRQTHPQMSRSERRALLSTLAPGTPSAATPTVTPSADDDLKAALIGLAESLKH